MAKEKKGKTVTTTLNQKLSISENPDIKAWLNEPYGVNNYEWNSKIPRREFANPPAHNTLAMLINNITLERQNALTIKAKKLKKESIPEGLTSPSSQDAFTKLPIDYKYPIRHLSKWLMKKGISLESLLGPNASTLLDNKLLQDWLVDAGNPYRNTGASGRGKPAVVKLQEHVLVSTAGPDTTA